MASTPARVLGHLQAPQAAGHVLRLLQRFNLKFPGEPSQHRSSEGLDDLTAPRSASLRQRIIGGLMVLISLTCFPRCVPRGWVPHDEGMLGQSAERVIRGGIPHVDYEETYTGGLTWLYAAVFRFGGIDLLTLRWVLYAAASLAQLVIYAIL